MEFKRFKHAILGGTFDHFHLGHKHFLDQARDLAQKLTIGLTTPAMLDEKYLPWLIENYEARKKGLTTYLKTKGYENRTTIIPINDIFGNALREKGIDLIVVTSAGIRNANIINRERRKRNFPILKIITVRPMRGQDNKIISSSRIRAGEIDRNGYPYLKIFTSSKKLILEKNMRNTIRTTPSGTLIKNTEQLKRALSKAKFTIAVGDVISLNLVKLTKQADISIIDNKVARIPAENKIADTFKSFNDPGTISQSAVLILEKALEKALTHSKQVIQIEGEEDLLALPAALLAPLETLVLYGMPGKGAIASLVTEKNKEQIKYLMEKFSKTPNGRQ